MVEFCSTRKPLVDAVVELARSLGQKPVCKESRAVLYGRDCGPRWRVTWRPTVPVFRLARKLERMRMPMGQAFRHQHRMIVAADPIEPTAMRCLTVDSRHHMYLAGEGMIPTHNTRSGAQGLAEIIQSDTEPDGQFGVIAPTYRDAWTVMVEGESGILRALGTTAGEVKHGTSRMVEYAHRSYGEIGLRSGHIIYVDSADDGAIRVQGKNLRAAWCGEIGLWQRWATAFDESVKYAVRKGRSIIICDGTPKVSRPARALIRRFLCGEEPDTIVRRLRTIDNAANLSEAFYKSVIGAAKGTRLERQELEGELLDDVENALWSRELLERIQVPAVGMDGGPARLWQAKVGVDPSDGTEDSDEQAYTVIGKGAPDDPHLYVAENWGGQEAPTPFARRCILVAVRYEAELVVEKNHGGEWLRATFAQVMKELVREGKIPEGRCPRVRLVHASQAKRTRAEPVSAMYERDVVRHCKMASRDHRGNLDVRSMVELEDQMVTFTGAAGERSPDRLDSLTWGATPFLNVSFGPPGQPGVRRWAGSEELEAVTRTEDTQMRRRLAGAHGGMLGQPATPADAPWDLDGFSPQDDEQARPGGRRGNVRAWR